MNARIATITRVWMTVALLAGWPAIATAADGSIVAWGWNHYGQCDVPAPNTDFVAVAGGSVHSLGLNTVGSIVAWDAQTTFSAGWRDVLLHPANPASCHLVREYTDVRHDCPIALLRV